MRSRRIPQRRRSIILRQSAESGTAHGVSDGGPRPGFNSSPKAPILRFLMESGRDGLVGKTREPPAATIVDPTQTRVRRVLTRSASVD